MLRSSDAAAPTAGSQALIIPSKASSPGRLRLAAAAGRKGFRSNELRSARQLALLPLSRSRRAIPGFVAGRVRIYEAIPTADYGLRPSETPGRCPRLADTSRQSESCLTTSDRSSLLKIGAKSPEPP
jgi:hypothetical protein